MWSNILSNFAVPCIECLSFSVLIERGLFVVKAFLFTRSLDFLPDCNIFSHFAVSCSVKFLGVADAVSPVGRLVPN